MQDCILVVRLSRKAFPKHHMLPAVGPAEEGEERMCPMADSRSHLVILAAKIYSKLKIIQKSSPGFHLEHGRRERENKHIKEE